MDDRRDDAPHQRQSRTAPSRRSFLAATAATAAAGLAGCSALPGTSGNQEPSGVPGLGEFRGSGPLVEDRPEPGGTSIADLPDLSGELTLYVGGGEGGLYANLIDLVERTYDDFSVNPRVDSSASLANTIVTEVEGGGSPADAFLAVDAGSVGVVTNAGAATALPDSVLDPVPGAFQDPDGQWVGIEGRARTIPYNTDELSDGDVPDAVADVPGTEGLAGAMGWAPSYSAFQAFVTAMRLSRGEDAARSWLESMLEAGVSEYPDEFLASNAVADGEITAAFANHYYALRVQNARPDAPIDLAFTSGDAGALVNVSAGAVIEGSENAEMAANFFRHLLSAEAQEYFATVTFGYPMVPEVQPSGGLPTIDELNPPDIDLTNLADLQPTLDLMREVGVL